MVSLLTKVFFSLIGIDQVIFIYELVSLITDRTFSPLTYVNYSIGLITILVLIAQLFVMLTGYPRYVSILLIIPVVNVFAVPYISYSLTSSKLLSGITFALWFANLVFTLVSNIPPIIYYGEGTYFLNQFIILDVLSLASLLSIGYCIIYREKKNKSAQKPL